MSGSNSYRVVWADTAISRDTNNLVTASIELFRNGDVSMSTNGVAAHLPRVLPFEHDGYGQDDAWVAANFTNATEILAIGYPQWVDSQVGTGLTNGLYKLTVAVAGHVANTSGIYFCNTDQEFAVDLVGTARLEKFGWFAEVTTNRVFSYGRNATP